MKRFQTALIFIASVFFLSVLLVVTGVAKRFEYVDVPLHILGGAAWALFAANLIEMAKIPNRPKWFLFLFTLGFVMTIGVIWELYEFLVFALHLAVAQTWRDTLGDLSNDGIGAILGWLMFIKNK